jgi:hypothetical protein
MVVMPGSVAPGNEPGMEMTPIPALPLTPSIRKEFVFGR